MGRLEKEISEKEKNRKLNGFLDALEFNQVKEAAVGPMAGVLDWIEDEAVLIRKIFSLRVVVVLPMCFSLPWMAALAAPEMAPATGKVHADQKMEQLSVFAPPLQK